MGVEAQPEEVFGVFGGEVEPEEAVGFCRSLKQNLLIDLGAVVGRVLFHDRVQLSLAAEPKHEEACGIDAKNGVQYSKFLHTYDR